MTTTFEDNTLAAWLSAFCLFVVVLVAFWGVRNWGLSRVMKLCERLHLKWMEPLLDTMRGTQFFIMVILAAYIGSRSLTLPPAASNVLRMGAIVAIFVQIGLWVCGFLSGWSRRYREKQFSANPGGVTTVGAIEMVLTIAVWVFVLLVILDNLGFNVNTLVAGLGIGGVAVALALQNVLGDLFASLAIAVDKIFAVGDFLAMDNYLGNVEHVGWKTTRLRSLSGEQIVFSNSAILGSRIRNYGRLYQRRLQIEFNVSEQTEPEKLQKIPGLLREAVEAQQKIRFDRAHFSSFIAPNPKFEYVYFVLDPDYNLYMDIQQNINLFLHRRFREEGIRLA